MVKQVDSKVRRYSFYCYKHHVVKLKLFHSTCREWNGHDYYVRRSIPGYTYINIASKANILFFFKINYKNINICQLLKYFECVFYYAKCMSYVCEFDECSSITIPPPPPPRPPRSSFTLSGKTRTIEDHLEDRMVKVAESMNCYWKSYNTGIILRFVNF